MGEYELALAHIERAGDFFRRIGHVNGLIFYNLTMAEYHRDTGNYNKALELAETALESAHEEMNRQRIKDLYELKSTIFEQMGDHAGALAHYKLYHQISDSLVNAERSQILNEMQIRYDVVQKDREIEYLNREFALQQAALERQNLVRLVLLIGLVAMLAFIALLFRINTERKRNNKQLNERRKEITEQNIRLAALLKDKDDFLSIVAHDLRNPISIVVSIMSLMKNDDNMSKEEIDEYIDMILISSDKMLHLVNDLLDIQSFSHNNFNNTFSSVNINEPLTQSVENFKRTARSKDIELSLGSDPNIGLVQGNSQKLARVFDNLISNAIKYSPSGSTIMITTEMTGDNFRVSVTDEGPGISEKDQEKLFGKFARLSNKPTGNETSTGLGLYIVKKLVSTMNGTVNCISEPGQGSTFYVEFPLSTDSEVEESESKISELQSR
jgi:signal transduction histidine kinase